MKLQVTSNACEGCALGSLATRNMAHPFTTINKDNDIHLVMFCIFMSIFIDSMSLNRCVAATCLLGTCSFGCSCDDLICH